MPDRIEQAVEAAARARPRAPAIEDRDGGLTYRDLRREVAHRADLLAASRARCARVLVAMRNHREQPLWVLACSAAGVLPIIADPRSFPPDVDALIQSYRPGLVICDEDDGRFLEQGTSIHLPSTAATGVTPTGATGSAVSPAAFAAMSTSGSTGQAKAAVLSHAAWIESAERLAQVLGLRKDDRALHLAPLSHGSGLLFSAMLLVGGTSVIASSGTRRPEMFAETDATVTFLVPTMLFDLLEAPGFAPGRLPRLKTVYYSGGPARADLVLRAAKRWGSALVQDYGLMEAPGPQLVLDRGEHGRLAAGEDERLATTVGRPFHPEEFAIQFLNDGSDVGVVRLAGPTLMSGYLQSDGIDRAAVRDGYLVTGDLAVQDRGGYVTLVGRTSNVIATGGRKVSPEHVEQVLMGCPGVSDVAVTGLPDERWGEVVTALIVPEPGGQPLSAIDDFAKQHLAPHERPKVSLAVLSLPVGETGKFRRPELRRLALDTRQELA